MGSRQPHRPILTPAASRTGPLAAADPAVELLPLLGDKYVLPPWSGRCEEGKCYLEVMRNGVIIGTVDLTTCDGSSPERAHQ